MEQHEATSANSIKNDTKDSFLKNLSDRVDRGIAAAFRRWSVVVSNNPYTVICFATVFALIWGAAFVLQFKQELDNDDLFTPTNAESRQAKDYVGDLYGSYTSKSRVLVVRRQEMIDDNDCQSRLLLKNIPVARRTVQEFFKLYESIMDMIVIYKGEAYSLEDICIPSDGDPPCQVTSILDLWNYNATIINAPDFNPLEKINDGRPALVDRYGFPMDEGNYLGKNSERDCEPETRRSSNVEALAMEINYIYEREEVDGSEVDPESLEWAVSLSDRTRGFSEGTTLDGFVADRNAAADASSRQIETDIELLTLGYILIAIYVNVVLYKNSCLACKMHLSIVSLIGISFALCSAYGMVMTFGVKVNSMVKVLPFLILGLGVDDTFVIIGAYQSLPYDLPVQERIAQTLEVAGSSIFITSATDFCAFLMGVYTRLPGVRAFAAYASTSIFFDFIFQVGHKGIVDQMSWIQVTFFVAFMVLEARREARYRNGCPNLGLECCCRKEEVNEGTVSKSAPEQQEMRSTIQLQTDNENPTTISSDQPHVWKKMFGKGNYDPKIPSFSKKLMGRYVPAVTLHPIGRFGVILVELCLLGIAIYGCTKVTMNFDFIEWFIPESSQLSRAYDLESKYFYGDQVPFSIYTKEAVNGDYFYHQDELEALKVVLNEDPYVASPVETWYGQYSIWLRENSDYRGTLVDGRAPNVTAFNIWLREFVNGPGQVFKNNLVLSENPDGPVISSKIDGITVDIIDGHQSIDILDSLRNMVERAAPSLDPVPFSISFLFFDGYRVIAWETIRNVLMAALGVFVMNMIVLASIQMAAIVVSMVALTDVVVIGYMWYVDQYFNAVTAINMVLIVGIAVDYSAHIAHSFLVLEGNRLERAKGALDHIGAEVLSGAFTTWLGIAVMGFAEHYFFVSFFRMFFAIILAGAWHGLILLPVVLSFVGSDVYASRADQQ